MAKIGDALKKAVELKTGEEDRSKARSTSPLMNANRRKIFQFLCMNPCSHLDMISSNVKLSRSSVSWHLDSLMENGYVQSYPDSRGRVFAPKGLVPNKDVAVFNVLNMKECERIYKLILRTPGTDSNNLLRETGMKAGSSKTCIRSLVVAGLIPRVMDGRHARYFPTQRYRDMLRDGKTAHKGFIRLLLRKLADEHLRPELYDMKGVDTVIEIRLLGQKERITVPQRKDIESSGDR